jgi:hypothetical protein
VDVGPALVADREASKPMEPRERPLDHPTVPAKPLARLHPTPCDARGDPAVSAGTSAARKIVALVGIQLGRALPRRPASAMNGPHGVEQLLELLGVVLVRWAELDREGKPPRVYQHMVLRARFAAIRRMAGLVAPFFAGTLDASSAARDQSMAAAACSSSSRTWCSARHTPASFQSRSRRQQVMPLPQPISWGSISHGMPLRRTKRMPVRAARSGTGGRPPFGVRRRFGSSGAIRAHNLSPTNAAATAPVYIDAISRPVFGRGFVRRS